MATNSATADECCLLLVMYALPRAIADGTNTHEWASRQQHARLGIRRAAAYSQQLLSKSSGHSTQAPVAKAQQAQQAGAF